MFYTAYPSGCQGALKPIPADFEWAIGYTHTHGNQFTLTYTLMGSWPNLHIVGLYEGTRASGGFAGRHSKNLQTLHRTVESDLNPEPSFLWSDEAKHCTTVPPNQKTQIRLLWSIQLILSLRSSLSDLECSQPQTRTVNFPCATPRSVNRKNRSVSATHLSHKGVTFLGVLFSLHCVLLTFLCLPVTIDRQHYAVFFSLAPIMSFWMVL